MNNAELTAMIKLSAKLSARGEVSEMDIKNVMEALDADDNAPPAAPAAAEGSGDEAAVPLSRRKQKEKDFDDMMRRVERKLEKATAPKSRGSVANMGPMFRMLDRSGNGKLDLDRVPGMLRDHLQIDAAALSDDDIAAFVRAADESGAARRVSARRARATPIFFFSSQARARSTSATSASSRRRRCGAGTRTRASSTSGASARRARRGRRRSRPRSPTRSARAPPPPRPPTRRGGVRTAGPLKGRPPPRA